MNLILRRTGYNSWGITSTLEDSDGEVLFYTLEHAYQQADGKYQPKLGLGDYECVLGMHRLKNMRDAFEAYEITDVPGHSGILFHVGNFNRDSEGCVLVGSAQTGQSISGSRVAFNRFMQMQGRENFRLTVI